MNVDHDIDWDVAIGLPRNYRHRDLNISKQMYDEIKYMNGYYGWWKDFWNQNVLRYWLHHQNCATFSRDLWNKYTGEWTNFTGPHTPGAIYNSIWWYNEQTIAKSQCGKGY